MKEQFIKDIRAFNRFYTDIIGLLNQHILESSYSLAEARIIYEIFNSTSIQPSQIMVAMQIDKSYLSRLLKKMEKEKLIYKSPSPQDARAVQVSLTELGTEAFHRLNQASNEQIGHLLEPLTQEQSESLTFHMEAIKNLLKNNEYDRNES